jgi:hypothetical protein
MVGRGLADLASQAGRVPGARQECVERRAPGVGERSAAVAAQVPVDVDVGLVDLLLADLLVDLGLFGDGLGAQPDPLDRDRFLFHHRALGVEGDLGPPLRVTIHDGPAGDFDDPAVGDVLRVVYDPKHQHAKWDLSDPWLVDAAADRRPPLTRLPPVPCRAPSGRQRAASPGSVQYLDGAKAGCGPCWTAES